MASRKKTRVFQNYAEALARTEELAASGDQESDDFLAAAEAAAQFFLRDHGSYQYNNSYQNKQPAYQNQKRPKWLTLKDLMEKPKAKHDANHGKNFVIVERQGMPQEVAENELDRRKRNRD